MRFAPSRFTTFEFTEQEEKLARQASLYTLSFLQNKIAAYANAAVAFDAEEFEDPQKALTRLAVLKGQVEVLEELYNELQPPQEEAEPKSGN